MKIALARLLVAIPFLMAAGAVFFWLAGWKPLLGCLAGLKLALLTVALHPFLVTASLSKGSRDDLSRNPVSWVIFLLLVPVAVIMLFGGLALILMQETASLVLVLPVGLLSWLTFEIYHFAWRRCWFDLQMRP